MKLLLAILVVTLAPVVTTGQEGTEPSKSTSEAGPTVYVDPAHADDAVVERIVSALERKHLRTNDPREVAEFLEDGIGELLNVIAGGAKTRLSGTESSFELSLPVVAVDDKSPIEASKGTPGVSITGRVGAEPLSMTIWMKGIDVGT